MSMDRTSPHAARRARHGSWIAPYLKRYGGALALAIALSVVAFIFAAALMFTSGYMISLAAALPLTVLVLHLPSIFVRIFGIGKPLLNYAERLISHNWVLRMTSEMRKRLYDALEQRSFALRSREKLGSILALLTEDIGHVQDLFLKSVIPLATSWLLALLFVICAGLLSVQLGLLFLILLVVIVVVMPLVSISVNGARIARKASINDMLYEKLTDNVEGISDWVLSGNREGYRESAAELRRQRRHVERQLRKYGRMHDLVAQVLFGVCTVALLMWASCVFGTAPTDAGLSLSTAFTHAIANAGSENAPAYAPNWIAAFVLCFFPLIEAFAPTSHAAMEGKDRHDALNRMDDLIRTGTEPATHQATGASPAAAARPSISLRDLSFAYDGSAPAVLHDINLHIPYGEHVAILGRSGTGKTTLASLIHGDFAPTGGTCTVGNLVPSNVNTDVTKTVGIIAQSPYLFNLTLRDNLKLADPHATDEELRAAIRAVGLQRRFEALPQRLDSVIEHHGRNFSGGEAQRIAVARILLAKQPIVVLDEPFAGLDHDTERALLETILDVLGDRTIITITHHLENIEMFDRVIFMQDGTEGAPSIAFAGTPAELLHDDRYRALFTLND